MTRLTRLIRCYFLGYIGFPLIDTDLSTVLNGKTAFNTYLQQVKKWVPDEPVIHIDDSDIVKPKGHKFESLGIVRDGSESTATKNVYKKGEDDIYVCRMLH